MKKLISTLAFVAAFLVPGLATAAVIHVDHYEQLPPSGTQQYDLDGDATVDLGLAEDCCTDERLWINGLGHTTDFQWAFVSVGDVIDASLDWVSGVSGYTVDLVVGTQYVATYGTSIGDFYGYFAIDFDGTDTWLSGFWYEDDGSSITVASVPEPGSLALFGLGLLGLGFARRRKAA